MTEEAWNAIVSERNMDMAMRKHMRECISKELKKGDTHDSHS